MRVSRLSFPAVAVVTATCLGCTESSDGAAGSGAAGVPSGSGGSGGAGGAADADDGGVTQGPRPIASPPTYRGSVDNSAECTREYITSGFEPADTARHPLFLYFTGTNFFLDEPTFREQAAPAVNAVTEAMARRGFVSLKVEYDNSGAAWASDHVGKLGCLFGRANPESILAVACAMPGVDCDLGIATWGHSLGGIVADAAARFDSRVRAAWVAGCCPNQQSTIAKDRLRVVNGEGDTTNVAIATMNAMAGFAASECPDDGRNECLRPDGSGWIIVRRSDCVTSTADHCWFDKVTCLDANPTLEPNWVDPASTKAFALAPNADWVALTVRRP